MSRKVGLPLESASTAISDRVAPVAPATSSGHLLAVEPLVTKKIVAAVISTSMRSVDRLVKEKKIPVIYVGPRCPRFRVSDVLRALSKLTVKEVS